MLQIVAVSRTGAGRAPETRRASIRRRREILNAYLLLAPAVLLVFGILAYPLAWEIWISLTNFSAQQTSQAFVGLGNYAALITEPGFWRMATNTLGYLILTTALKLAVGVGVAVALARPFPGRPLVFLAVFLPWAYPASAALMGWYWFMLPPVHASYGPLLGSLRVFFDTRLGDGAWGFLSLILFNVWRGGSFTGIFLLAALNAVPQELFEYAALEVRNGWRRFWLVTVPLLRPVLALATFLSLVSAVADLASAWGQSGQRIVYPVVWTEAMHYALLGGQWGKGAALSLTVLPVLLVILFVCYRFFEPLEEDPA